MPNNDEEQLRPPTPPVDPIVSRLASRLQEKDDEDSSDVSDSELLDGLDKEFDMSGLREKRMEELKREMEKVRNMRESEHGRYTEITDEKEVIRTSAKENRCVIHFYHRDFRRCLIMDKHLEIIAPRYFATRFIRVFVENVPWLVEKLDVKVLPCVICFIGGVSKDRLIGFEEIGNDDSFTTAALELRLALSGIIDQPKTQQSLTTMFANAAPKKTDADAYDDDD